MQKYTKFYEKYGNGMKYEEIDVSIISEYDQYLLMPEILEIFTKDGISSYMDGFFWTLNPLDYVDWLNDWLYFEDRSIPFARTAFGDIIFIREKVIMVLNSNKGCVDFVTDDVDRFFNWDLIDDWYLNEYFKKDIYDNLSPKPNLVQDECLGYFPLLSLGGIENPKNLKIVKMREYLDVVAKASDGIKFWK
jgi:hypothetical protein